MTHKCGPCGVSDESSKKSKCPKSKKQSGFSKKPCNANKKKKSKPRCHPSVEKFRSGNCQSAETEQKCNSTGTFQNCHESQKRFQQKDNCQEDKAEVDCSSSFAKNEARDCAKPEGKVTRPCSQEKQESPCSNAFKKLSSTAKEGACESHGSSIYSKIASSCKNLAKDFVKLKLSKPMCSEASPKYPPPEGKDIHQNTSLPCPPKAEKGLEKAGSANCSAAKVSSGPCQDKNALSWRDFFPLDARNDKLNACIEKYSKIDANQVISKCSQFANLTKEEDNTDKCLKKVQERCVGSMPSTQAKLHRPMMQIPRNYRTLMSRWAPTSAFYLSSTALFSLYLTEWRPVLKYVPLYAGYVEELERNDPSSAS